jgi:hypothetical protein
MIVWHDEDVTRVDGLDVYSHPRVHFSATLGQRPDIELALV